MLLLLLTGLLSGCSAKVVSGQVKLSSEVTEMYLSKFSFSVGRGFVQGNFSADGVYFDHFRHDLRIYLFSDEGFAKFNHMLKRGSLCRERVTEAAWSLKITPDRNQKNQFFSFDTEISVAGRTHYWYAFVGDCWLEEYNAHPPTFDYVLTFLNENGSHLPADERGLLTLHLVLLIAMLAYAVYVVRALYAQLAKAGGQIHLVTVLFLIAYVLQTLSVLSELLHLWVYSKNGRGLRWPETWFAMDQASSALQTFAELIISLLLVCVASGWTLVQAMSVGTVGDEGFVPSAEKLGPLDSLLRVLKQPKLMFQRVGPASLFVPVLAGVVLWLEIWGHYYDDDFNQFHDFEHTPGFLLMGLRGLLALVFAYGIHNSLQSTPHVMLSDFLKRLRVLGLAWFLVVPGLVLSTFLVPPYARHQIITAAGLTVQVGALLIMSREFLTKSEYFKLSSLSQIGSLSTLAPTSKGKLAVD
eukprot:c53698_g1_i1.p1 GENE.c53698_g1_i1~~c53698_g1_i1.p1  ORF type:complete len:469 (+),score=109.73 c53698_g1_i1:34-1440(+)